MKTLFLVLVLVPSLIGGAGRTVRIVEGATQPPMPWTGSPLTVDVTFTDGKQHYTTLCFADDTGQRRQRIDVYKTDTMELVDTRSVSNFRDGKCAVYLMGGSVRFRLTPVAGPDAIVSGILFQSTPPCVRLPNRKCKRS